MAADIIRVVSRRKPVVPLPDFNDAYQTQRVLEAAVAYNVAMWNRMAGLLEGSRLLDRLADDVLAADRSARPREELAPGESVFDSRAVEALVSSLRARVKGNAPEADGTLPRRT